MPSFKNEKRSMEDIRRAQIALPGIIQNRRTAAEETYQNVLNRLGAPGTYDSPSEPPTSGPSGPTTEPENESVYKDETGGAKYLNKKFGASIKQKALDPTKATAAVEKSSQFRTLSKLQAESEQMISREGELYDEMTRNIQLPIIEGSAAVARANAQAFKEAAARGGSARRQAFTEVQKIRQQQETNSQRMMQLSDSRLKLDTWARENARTNIEFAQNWASNLGGVRESYQSAMDQAAYFMGESALPQVFSSVQTSMQLRANLHAQKRAKVEKWVSGVLGVGALALGGAGLGLFGAAAQIGGATGALASAAPQMIGSGVKLLGGAAAGE